MAAARGFLGVLLACLLAASAAAKSPMISDYLANIQSAKPTDYNYEPEHYQSDTQTVCLKDTKWQNCGLFGCYDCTEGADLAVQTQFTCCGDEDRYGQGDNGFVGLDGVDVGSCDWQVNLYTSGGISLPNGVVKAGEATATCRMNRDADKCGGGACDKMVIGVQAGVYFVPAQSHYLYQQPSIGLDENYVTEPFPSCCILTWSELIYIPECDVKKRQGARGYNHGKTNSTRPSSLPWKSKKWATEADSSKTAKAARAGETAPYTGYALVFAGPMYVSSPNGAPHHVEETGVFEYVPWFYPDEVVGGTPVWVKPGTYRLKFSTEEHKY